MPKPFEFWHPRLAEAPYYAALLGRCAAHRLPPKYLAKANWGLDHGELGLGSKYTTQLAFDQNYFPDTALVNFDTSPDALAEIGEFTANKGADFVLKPDIGAVGKGIIRLDLNQPIADQLPPLSGDYLIQTFCPLPEEYGVFYVRQNGIGRITGINKKHFPTVIGDGEQNLGELAQAHYRFTDHWRIFMKYIDAESVPAAGEEVRLSFIGSHTMGCMFTDDSHLTTRQLTQSLNEFCADQPGFNFGRLDVRTASEDALKKGEFKVIEVNGIASLPTHMFDPDISIKRAYEIFLSHAKLLVDVAVEHRDQEMLLDSYRALWSRAKANYASLNSLHEAAMN